MEGFTYCIHLFHSGGIVMYPLLLLSIITVAIAVERFCYYRANRRNSKKFYMGISHIAYNQKWDTALEFCKKFPIAMSRIVVSGLQHMGSETDIRSAFEEQMTLEAVHFRRYLDYLSAIVTIAPLLGLLGTVTGMISTFSVLDGGAGASAITGGVGEALVATASGLCVAIIAFIVYTYYSHQLDAMINDTEQMCIIVLDEWKKS